MRHADVVIDNLLADGMIPPMLVVFPNGDANTTAAAIAVPSKLERLFRTPLSSG